MSEEKEYVSGFTPKVIVSGIILSIILGLYMMSIPILGTPADWPIFGYPSGIGAATDGLWVIAVIVIALVSFGLKFSRQEVTCLFTIILISELGLVFYVITLGPAAYFNHVPAIRNMILRDASTLIYPNNPAAYTVWLTADAPFNWDLWGIPLVFTTLFLLTTHLFVMFLMTLVRRLYIDVEAIPFPLAAPKDEMIGLTQPESAESKTPRLFKDKLFWIGFIPTFLLSLGPFSSILSPGTKSFWLTLTTPGYFPFTIDLTPLALLPWVPLVIGYSPMTVALGYIFPMNVLMTLILALVIFWWIIPPVLSAMGMMPPFPPGQASNQAGTVYIWQSGVPQLPELIALAIVLVLAVYPLWAGRDTVVKILKGLKGKVEGEETEPFNYRILWAGTIILGVILTAELIALGVVAWIAVATVIFLAFLFLGGIRVRGEAAGGTFFLMHHLTPAGQARLAGLIGTEGYTYFNTIEFGAAVWNRFGGIHASPLLMEGYRLGAMNKVKNRDIFLSSIIATLIIVPVACVTIVLLWHKLNTLSPSLWPYLNLGWSAWTAGHPYTYTRAVPPPNNNPTAAIAVFIGTIVLMLALYLIRARSRRFRLVPAAVIMALPYFSWVNIIPYVIAYVLKYITLKVWGVDAYQKKGLRLATGLLFGPGLGTLLGVIVNIFATLTIFGLKPII